MHLLTVVSVAVLFCSRIVLNEGSPWEVGEKQTPVVSTTEKEGFVENADEKDEQLVDEADFEDNYPNAPPNLVKEGNVYSMTHVHKKGGEILIPCFGMWWPIGGGGGANYDYGDDYYGDYRKRRRSRKRKKAAKMKRKKS